jgi:hypothetical protein
MPLRCRCERRAHAAERSSAPRRSSGEVRFSCARTCSVSTSRGQCSARLDHAEFVFWRGTRCQLFRDERTLSGAVGEIAGLRVGGEEDRWRRRSPPWCSAGRGSAPRSDVPPAEVDCVAGHRGAQAVPEAGKIQMLVAQMPTITAPACLRASSSRSPMCGISRCVGKRWVRVREPSAVRIWCRMFGHPAGMPVSTSIASVAPTARSCDCANDAVGLSHGQMKSQSTPLATSRGSDIASPRETIAAASLGVPGRVWGLRSERPNSLAPVRQGSCARALSERNRCSLASCWPLRMRTSTPPTGWNSFAKGHLTSNGGEMSLSPP